MNNALLSRAQVYVLNALSEQELSQLFDRAQKLALGNLQFSDEAKRLLIEFADGDARRLLNLLEQISTVAETEAISEISKDIVLNALSRNARNFDNGGDAFYDQISALHKSIRGSSPTQHSIGCAVCWMAEPMPCISGGAWFAWQPKTSVWQIPAPCAWR